MILTFVHDGGLREVIMVFGSYLVPCMCFLDICLQSFSKQTTHCLKIDIVEKVGFPFDCGYLFLSYGHYTLVLGRLHQFEQFDQSGTWCGYNLVRVLLL